MKNLLIALSLLLLSQLSVAQDDCVNRLEERELDISFCMEQSSYIDATPITHIILGDNNSKAKLEVWRPRDKNKKSAQYLWNANFSKEYIKSNNYTLVTSKDIVRKNVEIHYEIHQINHRTHYTHIRFLTGIMKYKNKVYFIKSNFAENTVGAEDFVHAAINNLRFLKEIKK